MLRALSPGQALRLSSWLRLKQHQVLDLGFGLRRSVTLLRNKECGYKEGDGQFKESKQALIGKCIGTEETQLGVTSTPSIYTYIKIYEAVYIETIMST